MKMRNGLALIAIASSCLSGCQSVGPNAAGGGAFGGLTGGLAGAAIGASEGKAPEGALIGALTGATVGGLAGTAVDRADERDRLDYQNFQAQQRLAAITPDQIIRMTQSGMGSGVIATQIQNQGVARRLSIDELILLKNQGVDDIVIQAIQNAPLAGQALTVPYARPVPVPVAEPVFVETWGPPPVPCYPRYRRRPCHPHSRVGLSFQF